MDKRLVAVVGMAGAGKSEVARVFEESGFKRVRFGDATDEELKKRGLELNEANERYIRESLRRECGMDVYAKLNIPRIDAALENSDVVVDGLYSWEEYLLLKDYYGERLHVVAVFSSPKVRYKRLGSRDKRPLKPIEAASRDQSEIEKVNKGGPIAMAAITILNEASFEDLRNEVRKVIAGLQ